MRSIVLLCVVGASFAARLDNTYLPPAGASGAGGFGTGFGRVSPPFGGGGGAGGGGGGGFGGGGGGSFGGGGGGGGQPNIPITRFENKNDGDGNYNYAYQTGNGISAQEQGSPRGPEGAVTAQGGFSYTGPDGVQYSIQYVADENGFRPVGAHIPTPPPIPDAILKSIEQNRAEAGRGGGGYSGGGDDGQYRPDSSGGGGGGGSGGGSGGFGGRPSNAYVPPAQPFNSRTGYNY